VKSDDQDKPSNAQSAMLDYYDDVLGSLENDPLKELVQEERVAQTPPSSAIKKKKSHHTKANYDQKLETEHWKPKKKKQVKKLPPTFYDEAYETKLKAEIVAPFIIPAAFPKMAPKQEVPTPKEVITQTKTVISKAVIESKTVEKIEVKKDSPKPPIPKKIVASKPEENLSVSDKHIESQAINNHVTAVNKEVPEAARVTTLDSNTEFQNDKSVSTSPENMTTGGVLKHKQLDRLPENGRPVWAQERFECLLFSVAGLKLAVPLISLGAIYKIENDFTPLIGRASWFMGLYRYDERNVRVIDTAQLVMPDRVEETTRENYQYIIRLGGNNWGMACDSVQESIQLEPEAVKWRTERSKRAWLSGTVIEHMCALIDVDALSDILKKEALSKHSSFNT